MGRGWWGGGVPGQFFFTEDEWLILKENIIFQGSRGVQHFPGGPTFPRGEGRVQLLIPYRNPYNL